ncbi:MAG: Zn-dependent alcohol dehydrogenase [Roseitalea sp.]|jgi:Zn-dependent alcohol dehydrogenase|nr:Zn-dependent alcohol dehydrogenase [Roseitalea sp.]MBO6722268.1 Zn-dependent alcohol dehydrogenase [Roseitalea sp.]MBO6742403.1 Zn-dependent alcohol dehydrogenase [Roseitalea sp.]
MPQTIRAAVCRAFGEPMRIEEVTLADPGPGEVLVAVKACAVCHSDITYADGGWGGDLPMVLGHEAAGLVEAVGAGVSHVKPGDCVVVTLIRACGTCHYCRAGQDYLCETIFGLDRRSPLTDASGTSLGHGLRTGAFAEKLVVEKSQLAAVDPAIPHESASLLACGAITGVGAVTNTAKMPKGAHAVVIGCGGVGLNAVQGARIAGAASVIAIDLSREKLDAAEQLGATHLLDPIHDNAVDAVVAATEGRGADFVFVASGARAALESATSYIGKNGTVVIVGMPHSDVNIAFNPASFAGFSQRILGSKMGSACVCRDVPLLAGLYGDGVLELDSLVTGRYTLDEINEAIAATKAGQGLRNVIVF